MSAIEIRSDKEVDAMRVACQMAAETLLLVGEKLYAGMSTDDINTIVHEDTLRRGAYPSPLNYKGFPKSVCTSVNEVVCHGIPTPTRKLKNGDIINVDVTTQYPPKNGWHGDTSATFFIGPPSPQAKHLVDVTRKCLDLAIAVVKHDARVGDIGAAIQEYAESQGCSVVRDYVGHGIGRKFHTDPSIPHFGKAGSGTRLKAGFIFTIEPMINLGSYECDVDPKDKWTVYTADRKLSAQFEHTILVTRTGCEVLTRRHHPLMNSEVFADVLLGAGL